MKLKPFLNEPKESWEDSKENSKENAISKVLENVGLKKGKTAKLELDEIRQIFSEHGAGIEDVALMTGTLVRCADKEETRLRAGELALKVQGIYKELDEKPIPVINITVIGSENQTLINLVCPEAPQPVSS